MVSSRLSRFIAAAALAASAWTPAHSVAQDGAGEAGDAAKPPEAPAKSDADANSVSAGPAVAVPAFEAVDPVPKRFLEFIDDRGVRWALSNSGRLERGSGCFVTAMKLRVGGKEFAADKAWMDYAGTRLKLEAEIDGILVTRDIYIDKARGAARYFDLFENKTGAEQELEIGYGTDFPDAVGKWADEQGKSFEIGQFGERAGAAAFLADGNALVAVVAASREVLRPKVGESDAESFIIDYQLKLADGERGGLVTWIQQRVSNDLAEDRAGDAIGMFFDRGRLVRPNIPADLAETVKNFPAPRPEDEKTGTSRAGWLVAVDSLAERIGVTRGSEDVLWVSEDSQLTGRAAGDSVTVETRFGSAEIPLGDIALLAGGGGRARQHRALLRDGTALSGAVAIGGLKLASREGWDITLKPDQLEYLVFSEGPGDGDPPAGAGAFFALHSGDTLAAPLPAGAELSAITPWGSVEIPLADLAALHYLKQPTPRYKLRLRDGSMLTAFIAGDDLAIQSSAFGEVKVPPTELLALWPADAKPPAPPQDEFGSEALNDLPGPACLLSGENIVAGTIANPTLHLIAGSTETELRPAEIASIRRTEEGEIELSPEFTVRLSGGTELTGRFREQDILIATPNREWQVPTQHFIASGKVAD
ncbi:MAG: hypothetical protein R3F11_06090 [Verrucomicrobiales bacterium]